MGDRKQVPVRFLHIPKCGGSTFSYILNREYRNGLRFAFSGNAEQDRERYEALRLNARDSCVLYRGHAPIETGIEAVDDALTITMFRDPVRRVKSFCQHVSEGKSPHLVGRFPPSSFNLDEFLESGLGELSNLQVKMMINCGSCEDSTRLNQLGGEVVDVAIKHLHERVAIFGLLEKYDESLIQFADFLGWGLPVYAKRNVQDQKRLLVFEPRHIQQIEALNVADKALYEHASEVYQKRYSLSPPKKSQEAAVFEQERHAGSGCDAPSPAKTMFRSH